MVVTLTPNPMWETTFPVPAIGSTGSQRLNAGVRQLTGKGINVVRALANLGHDGLGLLPGDDKTPRHATDVNYEVINLGITPRVGFVLVDPEGANNTYYEKGPTWTTDQADALVDQIKERVQQLQPDTVVLAGSLPPGLPTNIYERIAQALRPSVACLVLDAVGPALESALSARPDLVKVNRTEFIATFGKSPSSEDEYANALLDLSRNHGVSACAVTAGSGAAFFCLDGRIFRAIPAEIEVRNSVGSGDSLLAGWLANRDADHESLIRAAVGAGCANAEQLGVAVFEKERAEALAAQVLVTEIETS